MTVDPARLRIEAYPTEVLRQKADPVDVTPNVIEVAQRMVALMHDADGLGLAAPQVGLPWRLFVCHVPPGDGRSISSDPPTACPDPEVFINPEITAVDGPPEPFEEGCLSLPEITGDVLRQVASVTITATDLTGARFTRQGSGLLARCWQHELDHLNGVLILDRMTQMSRLKARPAVRSLEKQAGWR